MDLNSSGPTFQSREGQVLTFRGMTRDTALISKLTDLMVEPKFTRNIRGRLAAALRLLDTSLQKRLACDYAEHVVWICEEVFPENLRFHLAITETKRFLSGETSIEKMAQATSELYRTHYRLPRPYSTDVRTAIEAALAIKLAIKVCCQRELEASGAVMRVRYQPPVQAVATKASLAVAHYYGGENWDSDDPKLKATARKRGKAASDAETEWQMNKLLEVVGLVSRKALGLNAEIPPMLTRKLAAYA